MKTSTKLRTISHLVTELGTDAPQQKSKSNHFAKNIITMS